MNEDSPKKHHSKELPATISPACRAKAVSGSDLVDCLSEQMFRCEYRLSFGRSYFCNHPLRMEIIARTEAEKRPKKA